MVFVDPEKQTAFILIMKPNEIYGNMALPEKLIKEKEVNLNFPVHGLSLKPQRDQ